jgi:hypothetical protein
LFQNIIKNKPYGLVSTHFLQRSWTRNSFFMSSKCSRCTDILLSFSREHIILVLSFHVTTIYWTMTWHHHLTWHAMSASRWRSQYPMLIFWDRNITSGIKAHLTLYNNLPNMQWLKLGLSYTDQKCY